MSHTYLLNRVLMLTNDFCKDCMPMNVSILKDSRLHNTFFSLTDFINRCSQFFTFVNLFSVCPETFANHPVKSCCIDLFALTCPRADR